jgi:pyruvate dehydrogenase E1 component beta subunit
MFTLKEPMSRKISFTQAINEAMHLAMDKDEKVLCYGLGVDDPKQIFGTTTGLQESFGKHRVFDTPTSENAMTGVAIGAGLRGFRSVMTHQRLDFFLLAMDQLVNSAAKWHYMFGGQCNVPITIRLVIGRGWGQGPTHSQSLQAWFAHIPGLKVVMPATAKAAKGLLLSSIFDENPVIFMEHRWLHNQIGDVPEGDYRFPLGKADILKTGSDITVVAMSYMTIEGLKVTNFLKKYGISCELIDLCTVSPIDWDIIFKSVKKTGRLLALDTGATTGSISGEIIARVAINLFSDLRCPPERIAAPDVPTPTSPALTKGFYPDAVSIAEQISKMLKITVDCDELSDTTTPHDVPGDWFKGPF